MENKIIYFDEIVKTINKSNNVKYFDNLNYFILNGDKIKINYKKMINDIVHIKFTNDQKKGIIKILKFLGNPKEKIYGLYGYAGTGNTTTIIEVIIFLAKILDIWNFAKRQNFVVSSHFRKQEKISPNLENKPVLQGHRGSQ